jgi:thioredoxin reductase (NADPH)
MDKYDVVVIGGGPAGLAAGLYASRAGLKTLLSERSMFGGQIVNAQLIENYPGFPNGVSGFDLATCMHDQATKFGLEVTSDEITGIKVGKPHTVTGAEKAWTTDAIIIATGSQYKKLGIDDEAAFLGKGVSYCATCDGYMFKNKPVAVVGGGDTAISDALELSQHSSEVYLIHRRDQLRASQVLQNRAYAEPRMKFVWDSAVENISGEPFLKTVHLKNLKTGQKSDLQVSGLFVAVGVNPNSSIFKGAVEIDENGLVITDLTMATSIPGVFAAGDIRRNSPRQVVVAVGDGATAAISAFKYLKS